LIIDYIIK